MITNMSLAGIRVVLEVDLGSGEDTDIHLGSKTPHCKPNKG